MMFLLAPTVRFGFLAVVSGTLGLHAAAPAAPNSTYPPLPEAVASFGAATLDDWLYVYGGHRGERHRYNVEDVSGAFHRLKLSGDGGWERLPDSQPLQGAALVSYVEALYRIGGMAARNQRDAPHDLYSSDLVARFDARRQQWEPLPALPAPRSSHDAAVVGGTLFVVGGWQLRGKDTKPTWHNSVWTFDVSQPARAWAAISQPFKRRGLAAAALGSRLYCLGGMDAEGNTSLAVDVYDPARQSWSAGPELPGGPMKGFGCAATVCGGRLYVSGMKGALYRLASSGDAWEPAGQLEHPRFFHRLVPAVRAGLIALGGEDSEAKRNDLEFIRLAPSQTSLETTSLANPAAPDPAEHP